jgi:rhodanese-related sulfurtransferase
MTGDGISVAELQELLAAGRPVTVLDVRSPSDVDWEIPGAIHVDAYADLQSSQLGPLAELDLPAGPVVTVCAIGRTAAIATDLLRANGVEALTLDGGMRSWSLAWNTAQTTISGCEVVQVRRTGKGCLSYIVESESGAVVIDASIDPEVYIRLLRERGWRLVAVADTHIHADHLSRSRRLAHLEGAKLLLPAQDRAKYPFRPVADGDRIAFGSTALVATRTPGHTEESTTYVLDNTARSRAIRCFSTASAGLTLTAAHAKSWRRARVYFICRSAVFSSCPRRRKCCPAMSRSQHHSMAGSWGRRSGPSGKHWRSPDWRNANS